MRNIRKMMRFQIRHNNKPSNILRAIKTRFRQRFNRSNSRFYFSDDISGTTVLQNKRKRKPHNLKCGNKRNFFFIGIIISISCRVFLQTS